MKTFSFFSAKGGTGKTTFNMLFASYLSYVKGQRMVPQRFDIQEKAMDEGLIENFNVFLKFHRLSCKVLRYL